MSKQDHSLAFLGYPKNAATNPAKPYIYFDTLLSTEDGGAEIYRAVKPYFNRKIGKITSNTQEIDAALDFLKKIIDTEAQKEIAFINYFSKKYKDIPELQPPTLVSDWADFVKTIQTISSKGSSDLIHIKNEKNRLQKNAELAKQKSAQTYEFIQTAADQTSQQLKSFYTFIKDGSHNTNGEKILNLILNKFGHLLFKLDDSGQLIFDKSTLLALITMIQALLMKQYTSLDLDRQGKELNLEQVKQILNDDTEFSKDIEDFLRLVERFPILGQDLASSLGLGKVEEKFSQKESQQILLLAQKKQEIDKRKASLARTLQSTLQSTASIEGGLQIITQGNAYAEIESLLLITLSRQAIFGKNTGGAGAKPDNLLALLSIELDQLGTSKEITDEITAIHAAMLELESGLAKTNTKQYYKERARAWDKAQKEIDEHLAKLAELCGKDLIECFIIEDSTKNYTTLYQHEHYGKMNSDFHGGSLGPNITDQIEKLDAIYQTGGLNGLDKKWLIAAAVNAGTGMIAKNYKNQLEQYLATFACILLFDDQIGIAAEAAKQVESQVKSGSNVHRIHLFSLNGGYYPLSFILKITYDNLQKAYHNAQNLVVNGSGAKVRISNFVQQPQVAYNPKDRIKQWNDLSIEALNTTKIKLSFLNNFMKILDTLYPT